MIDTCDIIVLGTILDDHNRDPSVWIFVITVAAALVVAGFYILTAA